jgi:L-threonylcarbamoyladenylate synthase
MEQFTTRVVAATEGLPEAVALLSAGELVAFPTETVYGLGADARRDEAVRKIYAAKGRPSGNPVIVHVARPAEARAVVADWPAQAERLAERFWPGPLTLILPRGASLSPLVSAGRQTVALRCPDHPVATALLEAFHGPVAAPSANRSGFTSPTSAAHVLAELNGRIPLVLDGTPAQGSDTCAVGLESTVVDLTCTPPVILRPGAVTLEMLRELIPDIQVRAEIVEESAAAASPGQHSRHYAPRTAAYRFQVTDWPLALSFAHRHTPVALLTWAAPPPGETHGHEDLSLPAPHHTLRLPADEHGYARNFYAALRDADALEARAILVLAPPPALAHSGMWMAIGDRLRRATLPMPALAETAPDA